ncbi:hypothetical protein ATANTOWER_006852, partial [Ataeniobius toweri]|nr:hypothetical protein [Ataeniobius toweri]
YATTSAPVLISSSQAKPYMTTFTTPLSPEISKLGPCPVSHSFTSQNRITLDWNEKRPNIFSDGLTIKTPEKLPAQTLGGQVSRRLDFFSTMNASSSANSSLNKRLLLDSCGYLNSLQNRSHDRPGAPVPLGTSLWRVNC